MKFLFTFLLLSAILPSICFAQEQNADFQNDKEVINDSPQHRVDTLQKYIRQQYYNKNYQVVLEESSDAIALADQVKDFKASYNIGSLLGNSFLQLNDTIQAKRVFSNNLIAAKERGHAFGIIGSYIDLANIFAVQKDYKQAISGFESAIPLAQEHRDTIRQFILNYNIAELLLDQNKVDSSTLYINETQKFAKYLTAKPYQAGTNLLVGRYYFQKKEPVTAIEYLKESISLSKEINFMDGLIDGHDYYAQSEALLGNFEDAYLLRTKADEYRLEKYRKDKIDAIENVTAKFNLKQYEQELEATQLQNTFIEQKASRNKNFLIAAMAIAVVLCGFLISLLISFRKRKTLLNNLKDQNIKYVKAKEKSEELSKAKTDFLSNVSHELRTPLYGIIGLSSLLIDDDNLKSRNEDIRSLKFSADYLLALINDVLQINKLDATNTTELGKVSFDLRGLVQDIIKSFEFVKLQNLNSFKVHIDEKIPKCIEGDHVRLSQVLINLIGNACKFTENGIISLGINLVEKRNDEVCLNFVIEDTGIGISEEKQKYIFDEFTQDNPQSQNQGTGLGLSIVKKILQLHDSEVILESVPDQGTKIQFSIWYTALDNTSCLVLDLDNLHVKSIEDKLILIVDDNKINQIVTKKTLEKEGAKTMVANDGYEAINITNKNKVDLILMDITMPGIDGFETTKVIREKNTLVPIIALTAVEMDDIRDKIKSSQIDDFIIKPYSFDAFMSTLLKHL